MEVYANQYFDMMTALTVAFVDGVQCNCWLWSSVNDAVSKWRHNKWDA